MQKLTSNTAIRPRYLLLFTLLIVVSGLNSCVFANGKDTKKPITVILRYDDYSGVSNTDAETRILDTFRLYHVSGTFAVIPFVYDPKTEQQPGEGTATLLSKPKIAILRNAVRDGVLEIALHGVHHKTVRAKKLGLTEFAGVSEKDQYAKLSKAKLELESLTGSRVYTFVPPWNSYDLSTVQALEKLGFNCLSASVSFGPSEDNKLRFVPATMELYNIKKTVEIARQLHDKDAVIVALFHSYDFKEANAKKGRFTYSQFAHTIKWLTEQKDISIKTVGEAAFDKTSDFGAKRFAANESWYAPVHAVRPFLKPDELAAVYVTTDKAESMAIKRYAVGIFAYLLLGAFVYLLSYKISAKCYKTGFLFSRLLKLLPIAGVALTAILLKHVFVIKELHTNRALALVVIIASTFSVAIASFRARKASKGAKK